MENLEMDLVDTKDILTATELETERNGRTGDGLSPKTLTDKMLYLMQKISEYGYLTMPEVELIYANQTHAYKVLVTLKGKDLAGEFPTESKPRKAYYLRPKGYRTLEQFDKLRLQRRFLPQHFKPFIFSHRLACAKVGLILESHPLVSQFLPESLLWERMVSRRQKLCDGEFWYRAPGENPDPVGLEVELTLKNRDKLDDSLRGLKDREDLNHVWWVCGDETILRALSAEVTRRPWIAPQRHLFCRLEDFLAAKHGVRLCDSRGEGFSIDPAGPALRPAKWVPPPPSPVPEPPPSPRPWAQAEAPAQPQPAPIREELPRTNPALIFCRSALETLEDGAVWLWDSWQENRLPYLCALALLAFPFLKYRVWPSLKATLDREARTLKRCFRPDGRLPRVRIEPLIYRP